MICHQRGMGIPYMQMAGPYGQNIKFILKKMQSAIVAEEQWANNWGFKLSVAKTQI